MKFLTDSMFGKLTRLLRIFGHDTVYAEEIMKSAPDSELLKHAIKHDRIILTRDKPFHEIAKNNSIYLEKIDAYDNLLWLQRKIELTLDFSIKNARCSACNSYLKKVEDNESIKNQIMQETFNSFQVFFKCLNSNCNKIYWRGSHIEKIINKLKKKAISK
jgi:uncharacterized protein with PIN domain